MANSNARFGTDRERKVLDKLRDQDWLCIRTPGSKGAMDIVALRDGSRPRLIQVKGDAAGPFASFGPDARERLVAEAKIGGAEPWLAWWPRRGDLMWLSQSQWP